MDPKQSAAQAARNDAKPRQPCSRRSAHSGITRPTSMSAQLPCRTCSCYEPSQLWRNYSVAALNATPERLANDARPKLEDCSKTVRGALCNFQITRAANADSDVSTPWSYSSLPLN